MLPPLTLLAGLSPGRWLLAGGAVLAVATAALLGYTTWRGHQQHIGEQRAQDRYELALQTQKTQAAQLLAAQTTRALTAEREASAWRAKQEQTDATHLKTIAALEGRLRALAGPAGRLRDPHATAAGCGGGGAGPMPADPARPADRPADTGHAAGLLSAELSGLLRNRLKLADDINVAYASCRAALLRGSASIPPD